MSLENSDTLELLDRFDFLIKKYVALASDLAPKLEKFGKYRKELQLIVVELNGRGVTPSEPESLKQLMEDYLSAKATDTTEGS